MSKKIIIVFQSAIFFSIILLGKQAVLSGIAGVSNQPPPNLYIISIGIDKYQTNKLASLRFSKADALSVAGEFEKRGKNIFEKIEKIILLDEKATKADIIAAFEETARKAESNDVFVFSFAGFGGTHFIKQKDFHLLTNDANLSAIEETSISSGQLQALFRKIRAQTKLVILDSCDSAVGYESAAAAFIEQDKNAASLIDENVLVIGTDQITYENPTLGHGVMTAIILDGLKGEADCDGDGVITNYELMSQMYIGASKSDKKGLRFSPRTITRGKNFELGYTDKKLEEIAAKEKQLKESQTKSTENLPSKKGEPTRSTAVNLKGEKIKKEVRKGSDYAILFANDVYDNAGWTNLKNPKNDVSDVARELKERYGFQEVVIKSNLTAQEIYSVIEEYQNRKFESQTDDQLFLFFAGHGVTGKYNKGFYAAKDSPHPLTMQNESQFVALDTLLTAVDLIPLEHIMVVFDACYAGQIWKPSIQLTKETAFLSNEINQDFLTADLIFPPRRNVGKTGNYLSDDADKSLLAKLAYAKQKMKNRSRIVLTSGDKPVADAWQKEDGSLSNNSPFADAFLQALKSDGGLDRVLISSELIPFIDKLEIEPQLGTISRSDGAFVFVSSKN